MRVSLDSIVYAFLGGQTAEAIAQAFPVLTLEQVYGALTFYLAHRQDVDAYLSAQRADFESKRGPPCRRPDVLPEARGKPPDPTRLVAMVRFRRTLISTRSSWQRS